MAIGAQQRLAWHGKTLQVHLMTDTITWSGVINAIFRGNILQVDVVISVAKIALQHVVIDVADCDFRLDRRDPEGFELEVDHGARGVLGQRLIDGQTDLGALLKLAFDQVFAQDLLGNRVFHGLNSLMQQWDE